MLSMTTLMIGARTSLPNTNCFIKAIDVYLGICFSFVFGALLEYAVAHYSSLQQRAAKDRVRLSRALRVILPSAGPTCWSVEMTRTRFLPHRGSLCSSDSHLHSGGRT